MATSKRFECLWLDRTKEEHYPRVMIKTPTFYEFFAGGGMARAGLGDGWKCLFANDFDEKKVDAYRANWGTDEVMHCDVHKLRAADLPGVADLAWASFPCQDLSLAGNGAGLSGRRSGAFWGFHDLIHGLLLGRRAPRLLVLENVVGLLTSNGGADFRLICRALSSLGYVFGALVMDAVHFVPQSRPRLFIVATRSELQLPQDACRQTPVAEWTSVALRRAHGFLDPDLKAKWRWWNVAPPPAERAESLAEIIEEDPVDVAWHSEQETARLVAMMSSANLAKLNAAKASGMKKVGTVYRRTRFDETGAKVQRAELRMDGVAGCLRTPGGGSSRQFIMVIVGANVRSRLLSGREAARLMGLPDSFELPGNYNETYHLMGDGLAVPVVSHLANGLLSSLRQQDFSLVAAE